jgi:hypothetical protein
LAAETARIEAGRSRADAAAAARDAHLLLVIAGMTDGCGSGAAPIVMGLLAGGLAEPPAGAAAAAGQAAARGPWRRLLAWIGVDF